MFHENYPVHQNCNHFPVDTPISAFTIPYAEALSARCYAKYTIERYVNCLVHFGCWLKTENLDQTSINQTLVNRYLQRLLSASPSQSNDPIKMDRAALRQFLVFLPPEPINADSKPINIHIERFEAYLLDICGVSHQTCVNRCQHIRAFLKYCFGEESSVITQITGMDINAFFLTLVSKWSPASLGTVGTSLRSYLRFCALQGQSTSSLLAFIPKVASPANTTPPKTLTNAQVHDFLRAFDSAQPVGLRDYAIARCLLDLGLRGQEVTCLTLDSIDWRNGVITLQSNKSKRAQQSPLPYLTGDAISQYLLHGRPNTSSRCIFVRHRAPFDEPLSVSAIRNAMNRAFVRCHLRHLFCNTHVLRSTAATRLQKAGASIKEIADLLRHQSLDTAKAYIRVDIEHLRSVAMPWPGSGL